MATNEFLKKIKKKAQRNAINRKDVRFRKTIALLKGKGFLDTNLPIPKAPRIRVEIKDALWAGRNVEPRILEVLPAAILHYPKNFLGTEHLPQDLENVLKAIRNNAAHGPAFAGIPFEQMKHWANFRLKDRRTKPANEKKVAKYLMINVKHLNKLMELVASGRFKNQTSAIEAAIDQL